MFGTTLYGESLYGEELKKQRVYTLPDTFTDLTKYVPPYLPEYEEMAAIYKAQGFEIGTAHALMDSMFTQSIPSQATWGLEHWERLLGISASEDVDDETRQAVVVEKLAGTRTLTAARIVEIAENITGESVVVKEVPEEYKVIVMFTGSYGIPNHVKLFKRTIEALKPAHLVFDYTYHYVTWNDVADKSWDDISKYTWDGLRIGEELSYVSWDSLAAEAPSWRSLKTESWNTTTQLKEAKQ